MINRFITPKILELKDKYPVIAITGPRQSGKTSLAQTLFPDYKYYNLENLDLFAAAKQDPVGFLQVGSGTKMIIDEIQKLPELLSYIQTEVDVQKIDGQFVITGSQNFAIAEHIAQSLAGRVANFTLLPLEYREIAQSPFGSYTSDLNSTILRGFYPRPLVKSIAPSDFYQDYVSTYVERDVRQIKNIGDVLLFQKFLQLLAGRVGQIVNYSSLANDVGVNFKTIQSWISVLETSYIVYSLQPYFENFGKRVIKSPKVYFYDVGLLCYLLRINSVSELASHYAYGQIFENFVITEVIKEQFNERKNEKNYFWRDNNGVEVDMIIDEGEIKHALEIKSAQTYSSDMLKGLSRWQSLGAKGKIETSLVYNGKHELTVDGHAIKNWHNFLGVD